MPDPSFSEFATTFDRASLRPRLAEAEQQRQQIRNAFPLATFSELSLERYALKDRDRSTLCYLLEYGSDALGSIKGGSAGKLGIFYHAKLKEWKCAIPGLSDVSNAWNGLRGDLITAIELVRNNQFELIDLLPVAAYTPALRTKWLYVHQPDGVIPIYSFGHLKHYIEKLGGKYKSAEGKYTGAANHQLVRILRGIPELADWNLWEIAQVLYAWNPPAKGTEKAEIVTGTRYVKIAPGRNAMFWDDCIAQGYVCVGWDEVGDLSEYADLPDLEARFDQIWPPTDGNIRRNNREKAREVWTLRELQTGDLIVANRGMSHILGVGTVTDSGYAFDNSRETHKHLVSVDWDVGLARDIPKQQTWAFVTVADLTEQQRELIFSPVVSPTSSAMPALNRILYGPPGTGKTHRVIRDAAAICEGRELATSDAKAVYDKACTEGRVRLVTFHQSFSYEDFIEGIRPVMDEGGAARFEVRDGVFKEIATEALFACLERVKSPDSKDGFEERWRALALEINNTGELEIPGLKDVTWCLSTTEKGNLRAINKETRKEMGCYHSSMAVVWQKLNPMPRVSSMDVSQALGKGAHFGVVAAVYNYLQNIGPLPKEEFQQDPKKYSGDVGNSNAGAIVESYLKLGPASGWQLRADKSYPPYVLVIDEINRGNISRIFGELITLIEDDKRHGASNALQVMLPSSREPFTVPPNLFLLGTMNTADKSLALLDVALRRRFEFEELAPDFTICDKLPTAMREVLILINERIELRKDRDHRIGHAFFMNVSDAAGFNHAFKKKVVPLLQEYFFNDIDGARFVLGEEGRRDGGGFLRPLQARIETRLQRNHWRWFTDEQPGMDCWEQLQINFGSADD